MSRTGLRARLVAVASHVPEGKLTNAMLEREFPDWPAAKIEELTGIRSRNVAAPDEYTSDLAVSAAEKLFAERTDQRREDVDFLILVTVSPDYLMPFTAAIVQKRLGLSSNVGALDTTLACSGFVYGLVLAAGLLESGRAKKVLLLTADRFTTWTAAADRSVKALMGDAGTAALLEAVDDAEASSPGKGGLVGPAEVGTDGVGAAHLRIPTSAVKGFTGAERTDRALPCFEMNGPEVFNFTLTRVSQHLKGFLKQHGLAVEDVSLFVFHQANLFMLNHLRKRLGIAEERFAVHIAEVGNTSASTIPLALDVALRAGRIAPGSRVVLVGFGVGYSWGSVLLEYPG
jgi:3-oxoacyl-[acyl-carrier-protein] synthase III